MEQDNKVWLTVQCDESFKHLVRITAAIRNQTISDYVRDILEEAMQDTPTPPDHEHAASVEV